MKINTLGECIATRTLTLKNGKSNREIKVKIGKPISFPDGNDYYCPYQIIGFGNEEIQGCGGIDAVQALLLTLEKIGSDFMESEEYKQGKISWFGSENMLGFPMIDCAEMLTHLNLRK